MHVGLFCVNAFFSLYALLLFQVFLAELKDSSDQYYAIKVMRKEVVVEPGDADARLVMSERHVLILGCEHPFLTKLHSSFQTEVNSRNIADLD